MKICYEIRFCVTVLFCGIVGLVEADIPLTHNFQKEQIFVQGNWYNKDGSNGRPVITPQDTFQQCMHHNNASGCETTWGQRYWTNTNYYQPGRPIFIELAGEWDAAGSVDGGYWHNYARQYNAMLIVLKHRFYGGSFPIRNPTNADLWLMTSQLALADAARFIEVFTANNNLNGTSWVAFGCSYGGNLAAWFKLKYPNHVKTAVSSSAPVEALYDYPGYMQTVSDVVEVVDAPCYTQLYDTFSCMEALYNGSQPTCGTYNSPDDLLAPLQWCNSVDWNGLSREILFLSLAMNVWAANAPSGPVRRACDTLSSINGANNVEKYGNFMLAMGQDGGCRHHGEKAGADREWLKSEEAWQAGAAGWRWQTCNEFGYFMSSDPIHGLYGRRTWSGDGYGSYCTT
ncbi:putative serine protease F56F10.1 [Folsomia candida]|uniref:putative serine protease F56F10.1 n=1 Tax=Folsomia candida TaxID=158441 RepID=UPI0016054278|nr:putative serine protease F56F10.1 [Folsomia candida]